MMPSSKINFICYLACCSDQELIEILEISTLYNLETISFLILNEFENRFIEEEEPDSGNTEEEFPTGYVEFFEKNFPINK